MKQEYFILGVFLLQIYGSVAESYEYGIMIDAGSTHTQLYIYRWLHRQQKVNTWEPPHSEPITQQGWSMKKEPGISSLATTPDQAAPYMQPLFDFAKQELASFGVTDVSNVPIYLGATAGMRVLSLYQRESVIKSIRGVFAGSGFKFEDHYARILSGQEEAAFGWLTVNYLLSSFDRMDGVYYGALDMGGASTQLTFVPDSDILDNFFSLNVNLSPYGLYAKSLLNYGLNEASKRQMQAVADNSTNTGELRYDPCLNTGFDYNFTGSDSKRRLLRGTSKAATCRRMALALLDKNVAECWTEPCGVDGAYQPDLSQTNITFYAFSAFYSVLGESLGLGDNVTIGEIGTVSSQVCSSTYAQLEAKYGANPYLYSLCFSSTFYYALLHDGYGLSDSMRIYVADTVTKEGTQITAEVGWSLGAIMYQANLLPWSTAECYDAGSNDDSKVNTLTVLVVTLACGLLMSCAISLYFYRQSKGRSDDYLLAEEL